MVNQNVCLEGLIFSLLICMLSLFYTFGLIFSFMFVFFVILNPNIGLTYVLSFLGRVCSTNRVSNLNTDTLFYNPIIQYNGLVVIFSVLLLVHVVAGSTYFIIDLIVRSNKSKLNLTKFNSILSFTLNINFIFIAGFVILFYLNCEFSLDFANKASALYKAVFSKSPIVSTTYYGVYAEVFGLIIVSIAKVCLGIFRAYYVVNNLCLVTFKFNIRTFKFDSNTNYNGFFKYIIILTFMLSYVHFTTNHLLYKLLITPVREHYVYSLQAIVLLNSTIHYYLLVAILVIVVTRVGTFLLNKYIDRYDEFNIKVLSYLNLSWCIPSRESVSILIAFFKVSNSLGYFMLFSSGLVLFIHYIPSYFVELGLQYKVKLI